MENFEFKDRMHEYSQWRARLVQAIEMYLQWRGRYGVNDAGSTGAILNIISSLQSDRIALAFVAEFSRGKTELINALFFAEAGERLLPSAPGRTTMSPTELFWDEENGSYIRLLSIETRLEDISLAEFKQNPERWTHITLDCTSPEQMREAFKELVATKLVVTETAEKLGLWNEREAAEHGNSNSDHVEIPCWRHALISFPHPLLQAGLSILDTPGLNALGVEPELTLNILPSTQAVIFLIAADAGVTKSDMQLWLRHVCVARGRIKQNLAVVMNKIDAMWDDLAGEAGFEEAIRKQIKTSATALKLDENAIFPVSAKQALLAKVRGDDALLDKSRIALLEKYLANDILKQRRNILLGVVSRDIGFMVNESLSLSELAFTNTLNQLEEFKKNDFQNKDIIGKLLAETRDRQNRYIANVENFQTSRLVFITQARLLIDSFDKSRIDPIISQTRKDMSMCLTTFSMKQQIRKLFDDLRNVFQESIDITNETRRLVKAIHKKFTEEQGFKGIDPPLFSIEPYQIELEQIFAEGEAFRASAKTTMTEQSIVVNKLYGTLIAKARNVIRQAHANAITWSQSVLTPLMNQILDQKKQIDGRLRMLKKINESKGDVAESISALEAEISVLRRQRDELALIVRLMQLESPNAQP
ncbi:MAG: dynamin family protein [Gammaproteobacteria bacterium]